MDANKSNKQKRVNRMSGQKIISDRLYYYTLGILREMRYLVHLETSEALTIEARREVPGNFVQTRISDYVHGRIFAH